MLRKLISGMQTGADRGSLLAAYSYKYATGGLVPRGYSFLDGVHPEFATVYGVRQHLNTDYTECIKINIKESDGTIGFAIPWRTALYRVVGEACSSANCHYISVAYKDPIPPKAIADWILDYNISTLNVVGVTENISPGMETRAYAYMCEVFKLLKSYD